MKQAARGEDGIGYFGDKRRADVGAKMIQAMQDKRTVVLKKLGGERGTEMQYFRFLNNPEVTHQEMLDAEAKRVGQQAKGRHILVPQDTTEINYAQHKGSKKGFGTVGNGEDIGLLLHPQYALDADTGGIIGVVGCHIINRKGHVKVKSSQRDPDKRESRRWLEGMERASEVLKEAASITVVADRESDIFEAYAKRPSNVHVLTRAAQNRCLVGGGYLFEEIRKAKVMERYEITVPQKRIRPGRTTMVALRYATVEISRPQASRATCDTESVTLSAVFVEEIEPPEGEEPIQWMLLTTREVNTLEAAKDIVAMYRLRWAIEELNRALKSQGMDVEESQVTRANAIKKLAVMTLIAASRAIQLVRARDGQTRQKLTDGFDAEDIPILEQANKDAEGATEKQRNPHGKNTLAWAAWIIARLGGWNCYYKPPGTKTMNGGLQRFEAMRSGWFLAQRRYGEPQASQA